MKRTKQSHKVIAVFLTLNFLTTIVPVNLLFANNNGPLAPEATSFEPVDATDMVNLSTGDLSYVLPLLNIPSPEGGYPLALSYHAGIAMDQEASWVGLGWSLNPGAINRAVNGYPDDWKNGFMENILYDSGGEVTDFASSIELGPSTATLALSLTYNSDKGFGGSVGFTLGSITYDNNRGVGINVTGGLSKNVGLSVTKWAKNNETSIGLSYKLEGQNSMNFSLSSNSISTNNSGFGIAVPLGNKNSTNLTIRTSFIGMASVRFPWWGINLSFMKAKYSLYDNRDSFVNGICYPFNSSDLVSIDESHDPFLKFGKTFDANDHIPSYDSYYVSAQGISGSFSPKYIKSTSVIQESEFSNRASSFGTIQYVTRNMKDDIIDPNSLGQVSIDNNNLHFYFDLVNSSFLNIENINPSFNMALPSSQPITSIANLVSPLNTIANINGQNFNGYNSSLNRKKDGNFIDQFTVEDILNGNAAINGYLDSKNPNNDTSYSNIVFQSIDENAIGGFKITASDGKTYHYSLPVYQQEEFIRQFNNELDESGNIIELNEEDKFLENRKFSPYATHWLLTAITGPDYVKVNNNRHYPEDGDYGYWVRFDYGKWSDGFGWESSSTERKYIREGNYAYINGPRGGTTNDGDGDTRPNPEDQIPNTEINIKAYGVKQVYYLNQIKTRSHTALFIKQNRTDNKSKIILKGNSIQNPLVHSNVKKTLNINDINVSISDAEFRTYINVPQQKSLALDKIVLVKNEYVDCLPSNYNPQGSNGVMFLEESYDRYNVIGQYLGNFTETVHERNWGTEYYGNILDVNDIDNEIILNAEKVIDFNYNIPSSSIKNSISLNNLEIQGKSGISVTPPFKFTYNTRIYNENEEESHWGFNKIKPDAWSLKQITTPLGSRLVIDYESDTYFPVLTDWCETRNCIETTEPRELFIGGGLRVKSISLFDNGLTSKELYNYNFPDTEVTSGVSIYTPKKAPLNYHFLPTPQVYYKNVEVISQGKSSSIEVSKSKYVFNVFDLEQTPHAVYPTNIEGFFHAEGSLINTHTSQSFQDLGDLTRDGLRNSTVNRVYEVRLKNREIEDNFSALGQLLSISLLNNENQILNKVEYVYESPENIIQGKVREGYYYFQKNSMIQYAYSNDPILGIIPNWSANIHSTEYSYDIGSTYISKYPSILKQINSLSNGYKYISNNNKYDFLTGQVLETITEDSRGHRFKTEVVPAYTVSDYNPIAGYGMGAKVDNITNKNMLTQTAMSKSYIEDNGTWNITGVGVSTWNNNWTYTNVSGSLNTPTAAKEKIWRKHKTYIWNGGLNEDGTYQNFDGIDDNFNWSISLSATQTNPHWKPTSTITKYDYFSMPLEVKDINDNFASTKMDGKNEKIISTSNTSYDEQFYSGAEEGANGWTGGHVNIWNFQSDLAHTGKYSEKAGVGSKNFKCIVRPKLHPGQASQRYKISVWVYRANNEQARVYNGTSVVPFNGETITAGNWIQYNHYVDLSSQKEIYVTSNSGSVRFDDFRLHPEASSMTSYVYNEWDELSYILGSNNLGTHFIYDAAGRLIETKSEVIDDSANNIVGGFKTASKNYYNYKNQ